MGKVGDGASLSTQINELQSIISTYTSYLTQAIFYVWITKRLLLMTLKYAWFAGKKRSNRQCTEMHQCAGSMEVTISAQPQCGAEAGVSYHKLEVIASL